MAQESPIGTSLGPHYQRPGPPLTQQTFNFSSGQSITYGPYDIVPSFNHDDPFVNQADDIDRHRVLLARASVIRSVSPQKQTARGPPSTLFMNPQPSPNFTTRYTATLQSPVRSNVFVDPFAFSGPVDSPAFEPQELPATSAWPWQKQERPSTPLQIFEIADTAGAKLNARHVRQSSSLNPLAEEFRGELAYEAIPYLSPTFTVYPGDSQSNVGATDIGNPELVQPNAYSLRRIDEILDSDDGSCRAATRVWLWSQDHGDTQDEVVIHPI